MSPKQTRIAFTHVAVVDVQSGNISPDMTVLISGQKIREVGSSRVVHVPNQAHSADDSQLFGIDPNGRCSALGSVLSE